MAICTTGTLTGALKGTLTFTGTSLFPTVDTPSTGVVVYTGDVVITTKDGTLSCDDAGVMQTSGPRADSGLCVITGGTGNLLGASGYLQFRGVGGAGEYTGTVEQP